MIDRNKSEKMGVMNCCGNSGVSDYTSVENHEHSGINWKKISIIIGIVIFSILFLIFVLIWIVFPLVFMLTKSVQHFFMFFPIQAPKNPDFNNASKYNIEGVENFYITVKDVDDQALTSIGAWMISPQEDIEKNREIIQTYSHVNLLVVGEILKQTDKPILLYMHGVACNRAKPVKQYQVFRKYFLVIAIDHRGYGDSGQGVEMTEVGIVNDAVQIYQWIRRNTNNEIFVWGHSLGSALNAHTVRKLKTEEDMIPMGVILESPFSTMRDEVNSNSLTSIFRWLAYFNATFLDPLPKNGFNFVSTSNILYVDCPIMILHAEDDDVIPAKLSRKLYDVALSNRRNDQGNITYHLFPAVGYKHNDIVDDPNIFEYIEKFVDECRNANMMKN